MVSEKLFVDGPVEVSDPCTLAVGGKGCGSDMLLHATKSEVNSGDWPPSCATATPAISSQPKMPSVFIRGTWMSKTIATSKSWWVSALIKVGRSKPAISFATSKNRPTENPVGLSDELPFRVTPYQERHLKMAAVRPMLERTNPFLRGSLCRQVRWSFISTRSRMLCTSLWRQAR